MCPVIGHDATRSQLAQHDGSFALLGPEGVGRSLVVAEWLGDRTWQPLSSLDRQRAFVPGVVYVLDDVNVRWDGLLRPIEEQRLTLAVIGTNLPAPVQSRLPVFRVGLLTDFEVGRILQEIRLVGPRQLIARLLGGSLANLPLATAAVRSNAFDAVDQALAVGLLEDLWAVTDFKAALFCFQVACSSVVATWRDSPFQDAGLTRIPWGLALRILSVSLSRMSEAEARNLLLQAMRQICPHG